MTDLNAEALEKALPAVDVNSGRGRFSNKLCRNRLAWRSKAGTRPEVRSAEYVPGSVEIPADRETAMRAIALATQNARAASIAATSRTRTRPRPPSSQSKTAGKDPLHRENWRNKMPTYRKLTPEIEAIQLDLTDRAKTTLLLEEMGATPGTFEMPLVAGKACWWRQTFPNGRNADPVFSLVIHTYTGEAQEAKHGDYIVTGRDGNFYVEGRDEFEKLFERV